MLSKREVIEQLSTALQGLCAAVDDAVIDPEGQPLDPTHEAYREARAALELAQTL